MEDKTDYSTRNFANINEEVKLNETQRYFGRHRGLRFEINHFTRDWDAFKKCWTYYVIIDLDQIDKEFHKELWLEPKVVQYSEGGTKRISYDYYNSKVSMVDWHGGVTWYSKESGTEHEEQRKVVKFGCDFQHLWDEGVEYSLPCVIRECKDTIDQLIQLFGEIKYYTNGDGKYRYDRELTDGK